MNERSTTGSTAAIRAVDLDAEVVQDLVAALLADLAERYGSPDTSPPPEPADFRPPDGCFVVAEIDGVAVGCGGIRRHDATGGEIKRMYVAPTARGRGVARAILRALEDAARAAGYRELRLESGMAQPEALALYASAGFVPIPPYGYYADSPESRHLGKQL